MGLAAGRPRQGQLVPRTVVSPDNTGPDVSTAAILASMTKRAETTVRSARPDDVDQIADVLAAAFADYPWTRWTVDPGDHRQRITQLQHLAIAYIGIPLGHTWVAVVDGDIRAAASWIDRTTEVPPAIADVLADKVAELEGCHHRRSIAAEAQLRARRPTRRHLQLEVVGTDPGYQRTGLGRGVLQPGLALAAATGVPARLETSTPDNVAFYETIGFVVTDHLTIDDGGPDVWAMQTTDPVGSAAGTHERAR